MKEILISLLPLFNLAVTLVLVALFIAMVKTWVQLMRKKPDKNKTAEVFSVLKSLGILVRKKPPFDDAGATDVWVVSKSFSLSHCTCASVGPGIIGHRQYWP